MQHASTYLNIHLWIPNKSTSQIFTFDIVFFCTFVSPCEFFFFRLKKNARDTLSMREKKNRRYISIKWLSVCFFLHHFWWVVEAKKKKKRWVSIWCHWNWLPDQRQKLSQLQVISAFYDRSIGFENEQILFIRFGLFSLCFVESEERQFIKLAPDEKDKDKCLLSKWCWPYFKIQYFSSSFVPKVLRLEFMIFFFQKWIRKQRKKNFNNSILSPNSTKCHSKHPLLDMTRFSQEL